MADSAVTTLFLRSSLFYVRLGQFFRELLQELSLMVVERCRRENRYVNQQVARSTLAKAGNTFPLEAENLACLSSRRDF